MHLVTSEGSMLLRSAGTGQEDISLSAVLHETLAHRSVGNEYVVDEAFNLPSKRQVVTADDLHLMALLAHRAGESKKAIDLIGRAIEACPDEPMFYNNCGEVYRALEQFRLALTYYERALAIDPLAVGTLYNVGLVLQKLGRHDEAVGRYEQVLASHPGFVEAHNNLGVAFQELNRLQDARVCYERALAGNPYFAEAHNNLGVVLKMLGRPLDAILHHQTAMRLKPGELLYRVTFVECLSELQIATAPPALKSDLIAALSQEGLDPQDLAFPSSSLITHSDPFQALAAAIDRSAGGLSFDQLWTAGLDILHGDPLFTALLRHAIIRDYSIERVLAHTRRALLHLAIASSSVQAEPRLTSFVCALALQCFYNGYVYAVTDQEAMELQALRALVQCSTTVDLRVQSLLLAIVACYTPLYNLDLDAVFPQLSITGMDSGLRDVVTQQFIQVKEEQRLRNELETIGAIDDDSSQAVRAQYEEHPYPRWLCVPILEQVSLQSLLTKLFPQVAVEHVDATDPEILIPGCGTGQQAISRARQVRGAKVLGVDLSGSSLSYAKRKACELNIHNVEFRQGDILKLGALGTSFDMIECIGVLHHMQDPIRGWQVLVDLLKPGGVMRVGLYSEYARRSIVAAQVHVAKMGYKPTPDGIRRARQYLSDLPRSSSIAQVTQIKDFYTMAEARDLLFHVRERRFTLLEISEIIEKVGVKFLGFEFNRPEIKKKYCDRFPDDPTATSLRKWHVYEQENTDAFLGLYLFWVQNCRS